MLGPAIISNYDDFKITTNDQMESSEFAVTPKLMGAIAEGYAMTT